MDNTVPHHDLDDNPYTVYKLVDQRDFSIRYIGITDDVYARFAQHLRGDGSNPDKDAWMADQKAANVMPLMLTIETVRGAKLARERETFWIHHYRFLGVHLYNQVIPTIHIAPTPHVKQRPLFKSRMFKPRNPDAKSGRKYGTDYEKVRELVLYRHTHGKWPAEVSPEMARKYERNYFKKPGRSEQGKGTKMHAQRLKAWERGRRWIEEQKAELFVVPKEAIEDDGGDSA